MDTTNKLAEEQERARFEAHWSRPGYAIDLTRKAWTDSSGFYVNRIADAMYCSWLAAKSDAAQATQAVSEPVATQPAEAVAWIEWKGAEVSPVEGHVVVQYRLRGEGDSVFNNSAGGLFWHHDGGRDDIVAYRVSHPAPASTTAQSTSTKDNQ